MASSVTVAIPTLLGGETLRACVASMERQSLAGVETIVIDNSGAGVVRALDLRARNLRVIEMPRNVGFGAAINAAARVSEARYLAVLNDDAVACPDWLAAAQAALEQYPEAGMCASRVLLAGENRLDSAGMRIVLDGSSKQDCHGLAPGAASEPREALLPSGSAALFRRAMLDEIGWFDEDFFLYCEDSDLGLRAQRAGWTCRYEPAAQVEHHYSKTAGRVSPLKAFFVERNRLWVALKNFPAQLLGMSPLCTLERYLRNAAQVAAGGNNSAAEFTRQGNSALSLPWIVVRAHAATVRELPRLLRLRRAIERQARVSSAEFERILRQWSMPVREFSAY